MPRPATPSGRIPDGDPAADRRRRLRLLGVALGTAAIVVAIVVAAGAFKPDPTADASRTTVAGIEVRGAAEAGELLRGLPQRGTTLGRADAPVTILVISDLKCPSCRDHAIEAQRAVVDRLVRTGRANLRLELVNLRDRARGTGDGAAARRAAYALAATDRFWPFVQTAFWNQRSTRDEWATEPLLRAIAAVASGAASSSAASGSASEAADLGQTPAVRAAIAAADRLASDLGTDATPSVHVLRRGARTGERVGDVHDVDAIAAAVDRAARGR